MKKYTLLFITSIFLLSINAQDYKVPFSSGTIVLSGLDDVIIEGYNGSDVVISTKDYDSKNPERAEGLKLVNSLGLDDNTGIGLSAIKEGQELQVAAISTSCGEMRYTIKVPNGLNVDYTNKANSGERFYAHAVGGEIVVSTNYASVELVDVSGPLSIKSVYGSVEAVFDQVAQKNAISLYSTYDFVDVSLPSNTKATVDIHTPYGGIYTDIDVEIAKNEGMRNISSKKLEGDINGGGVVMNVKSGYDNVYLRKKK